MMEKSKYPKINWELATQKKMRNMTSFFENEYSKQVSQFPIEKPKDR